jgi:hypothetical protein
VKRRNEMAKNSLAHTIAHWERLLAAVEENRKDLPFLEMFQAQLGKEMVCVKDLRDRKSALRAERLQASRDLRVFLERGRDLASRIQAGARTQYGIRSEKLTEFGIRLRRRKTVREKPRKEKENEAPRNPTAP